MNFESPPIELELSKASPAFRSFASSFDDVDENVVITDACGKKILGEIFFSMPLSQPQIPHGAVRD
jgi:hypothetical protein